MRFFNLWFMNGAVLSLIGMWRTFIGGTALSMFLIKSFGLQGCSRYTLELLEHYLDLAEPMVDDIPPIMTFMLKPFDDYLKANRTYVEILKLLVESEFPATCDWYWQQPGYPEKKT